MLIHPPDLCVVHPLPPAPHFVGRDSELEALRLWWREGGHGVLSLVGLGGAGKTALAARFLDALLGPGDLPRPDGLFVWSFYQQPDAGLFLQEAYRYFSSTGCETSARQSALLSFLHGELAKGGVHLLVLDGLELVQQQESTGTYGQLKDPLLRKLLIMLAEGVGRTAALVTTRFPLTDLAPFQENGYRPLDIGGLDLHAARALLRSRGVQGAETSLEELVDSYGAHALTLDHLGGIIGQFLGGDARRAPEAPALVRPGSDRQALRLARLLRAYEEHLPPVELALLCRLCLLRRSLTEEQTAQMFLCSPPVYAHTIRKVSEQITHLTAPKDVLPDDVKNCAEAVGQCLEELLSVAAIAGPEDEFRQEVLKAAATVLEREEDADDAEFTELARLYAAVELDVQDDRRPLPPRDREILREMGARYLELRNDPLMPFNENVNPALEQAFSQLGWKRQTRSLKGDFRLDDLLYVYKRVCRRLRHLACKHFMLKRVRELCRFFQRKWALAGPLVPLERGELRQVLDALVGRHLAVKEADGSFSIHPAVRDHFSRVAETAQQASWHDLLREQMLSLVQQPGQRLPRDAATLDLVEEAIFHALQAGRVDEAVWLYREILGGMRHLAWKLGEMSRGLRILRGFDPCPDPDGLAWFLRGLGELDEAHDMHPMPYFRADVRLLQGRLPQVAAEGDEARSATAAFLMGQARELPPDLLGSTVPRKQLLLYLGRLGAVRSTPQMEALYQEIGWEGDRARQQLIQAEVARRQADMDSCLTHLRAAAAWILHSGSVEHLCLWHLIEARAARDRQDQVAAQRAVEEGLALARRCGLGLLHFELLCEQAEQLLAAGQPAAAETAARDALGRATAADCQFQWGAAEAGHLLGQALAVRGDHRAAAAILQETLDLRLRLEDPKARQTERLLEGLRETNA